MSVKINVTLASEARAPIVTGSVTVAGKQNDVLHPTFLMIVMHLLVINAWQGMWSERRELWCQPR